MLDYHKANHADVTIACMPVPIEEASRFGVMITDGNGRITEFEEKPEHPRSNLASMGIYIFSWKALKESLTDARGCSFGIIIGCTATSIPPSVLCATPSILSRHRILLRTLRLFAVIFVIPSVYTSSNVTLEWNAIDAMIATLRPASSPSISLSGLPQHSQAR